MRVVYIRGCLLLFVCLRIRELPIVFVYRRTAFSAREGGVPRGSSRTLGNPPWGLSLALSAKKLPRSEGFWIGITRNYYELLGNY